MMEWTDGVLSSIMRRMCQEPESVRSARASQIEVFQGVLNPYYGFGGPN